MELQMQPHTCDRDSDAKGDGSTASPRARACSKSPSLLRRHQRRAGKYLKRVSRLGLWARGGRLGLRHR